MSLVFEKFFSLAGEVCHMPDHTQTRNSCVKMGRMKHKYKEVSLFTCVVKLRCVTCFPWKIKEFLLITAQRDFK